jgi:uncharacterized membrane protein YphA (DoxX/SURF4 family)
MHIALLLCRLVVGFAFIAYGTVKLLGGQFHHGDFLIDSRTTDGTWLVWCFFGYSPVYARFIGLCELGPGLLVLIPRTRTLGALALFAVSLNITMMDFCFDFPPVKYTALLLTVLCGVLVASDYRRLKLLFWDSPPAELLDRIERELREAAGGKASAAAGQTSARPVVKGVLIGLLGLSVVLPLSNLTAVAVTPGPEEAALAKAVQEGWDRSKLRVRLWRKTRGDWGVNMEGYVELETTQDDPPKVIRVLVQRPHGFVGWRAVQVVRGDGQG